MSPTNDSDEFIAVYFGAGRGTSIRTVDAASGAVVGVFLGYVYAGPRVRLDDGEVVDVAPLPHDVDSALRRGVLPGERVRITTGCVDVAVRAGAR